MDQPHPKPQDRRAGEPNLWYQRFIHYLDLGPRRSLARCYRETTNPERARQGRPLLSTTASCPDSWHKRARQFEWSDRAAAWDRAQKHLELEQVEHVRVLTRELAEEAIQVLKQTMRGELKNPAGTLTEGQNCTQRRLAAEKILDLAGVDALQPGEFEAEDEDTIEVIGIRINTVHSPNDIEPAAPDSASYPDRQNGGREPSQNNEHWVSDG